MTTLPFFREPPFVKWALSLWRRYSWRSDFTLKLDATIQTAYVVPATKLVVVNPTQSYPQRPCLVRHLPPTEHALSLAITENRLAHEAAHVLFSCEKPPGLLGQLWNMLEDERIERLMAQRFAHLTPLFTLKRDLYAESGEATWTGEVLDGVLYWRFTHTHPIRRWQPAQEHAELWADVRPLIEAAWDAPDSDRVTWIARMILQLCGREETEGEDDTLPSSGDDTGAMDVQPGAGAGSGAEEAVPAPPAPDTLLPHAQRLLTQVEGSARALAKLLAPPDRPARTSASRDRGRFRYDRHQGGERPFDLRTPGAPGRVADVRLLVDLSGSMNPVLPIVQELLMTVERASRLTGSPLTILGFDHRIIDLRDADHHPIRTANRIATLGGGGGTALAPALRQSLQRPTSERSVTIIITDGDLSDHAACRLLKAQHPRMTFFPVLLGQEGSAAAYEAVFGRSIALQRAEDLPTYLKAYLRT